ncbi:hypothetical protein HNY73_005703 [Argiope bruennichi]|uniref:Uncharacterized protein n=1 Tax=Argiope bruennichi TaxID=94029 RepID=A0A8T0FHH8_ARGBR|nr:hypothetical protein HNY73_005703 [Argiope bruennichi]
MNSGLPPQLPSIVMTVTLHGRQAATCYLHESKARGRVRSSQLELLSMNHGMLKRYAAFSGSAPVPNRKD